ncbi:MAG TPA: DUF1566 domain-containing protein [Ideonella sp.]|nr:DUF1566 domain-containing protein [Ideonella sp.]
MHTSTTPSPSHRAVRRLAWAAFTVFTFSTAAHTDPVAGQGTWETTLSPRDLDGDGVADAYYDSATRSTWLADANPTDGPMSWDDAKAWARQYKVNGIKGWRLPRLREFGNPGCDFGFFDTDCGFNVRTTQSELAYMYYVTLGNKSYYDTAGNPGQPGWGLTNTGPFSKLQAAWYWSNNEYKPFPDRAWEFDNSVGGQSWPEKQNLFYVWLVRTGDVGTPVAGGR